MNYLLHHYLEQHAQNSPEREAFRDGGLGIKYGDAATFAARVAALLEEAGVGRGDRVIVHMKRGLEASLAIFGVLRAGAAYVPLDPQAPAARAQQVLDLAEPAALIVDSERAHSTSRLALPKSVRLVVAPERDAIGGYENVVSWNLINTIDPQTREPTTTDEDLSYIIFTSGSTGAPKGIMHTHRSALAYARWAADEYGLTAEDRVGSFSPFHFDISTFDLFAARLAGASTITVPQGIQMFPASCSELLDRETISVVFTVPHALQLLSTRGRLQERNLSHLRWLIYGGEPYPASEVRELMKQIPSAAVSNMYGPAEVNGVTACHLHAPPEGHDAIPIGPPAANVEALVMNEADEPVTPGQTGELLIRSSSRMLGYWKGLGDPGREPFFKSVKPGGLVHCFYRTGDMVRELPNGSLVFAGRRDHLVKVRGHRIELAEVDAALSAHPEVVSAAAFTVRDPRGAELLAAVELIDGSTTDEGDVLKHLRSFLPPYAIPARIEFVPSLPRTSTGKVDRRALQQTHPPAGLASLPSS